MSRALPLLLILVVACGDSDGEAVETSSGSTGTEASTATTAPTGGPTSVDTTATGSTTMAATDTNPATTEADASSSSGGACDPFIFNVRDDPPEAYAQEDNAGFPAVNATFNLIDFSLTKDEYNQAAPPVNDLSTIGSGIRLLHCGDPTTPFCDSVVDGLRNDLLGLALTPCAAVPAIEGPPCFDQMGTFVDPDQLTLDLDRPSGFPNGRAPGEYVMDEILAYLLLSLDLGPGTGVHDSGRFEDLGPILGDEYAGLGLNPATNDVPVPTTFPYLAPAH